MFVCVFACVLCVCVCKRGVEMMQVVSTSGTPFLRPFTTLERYTINSNDYYYYYFCS
jgi:hypothetical protein